MALFEIHQRFKGHFLNELRASFKHFSRIKLSECSQKNILPATAFFPIKLKRGVYKLQGEPET